jgi:hypothetical protein
MIAERIHALGEIGFCHRIPAVIFLLVSVLTLQEYGRNFTCDCKIMIGRVISGLSYNITERIQLYYFCLDIKPIMWMFVWYEKKRGDECWHHF